MAVAWHTRIVWLAYRGTPCRLSRNGRVLSIWHRLLSRGSSTGYGTASYALDQSGNFIKWNTLVSQRLDQHDLLLGFGIKSKARGCSSGSRQGPVERVRRWVTLIVYRRASISILGRHMRDTVGHRRHAHRLRCRRIRYGRHSR
jgi:hypothetical protein